MTGGLSVFMDCAEPVVSFDRGMPRARRRPPTRRDPSDSSPGSSSSTHASHGRSTDRMGPARTRYHRGEISPQTLHKNL
jgi:hypothetical protein